MKTSAGIKYYSMQRKPTIISQCFCNLTAADCPVSCVWLASRATQSKVPFLGWGETFKKEKQASHTDGRDSQAGLLYTIYFWFRQPEFCMKGQSISLLFLRAMNAKTLQTGFFTPQVLLAQLVGDQLTQQEKRCQTLQLLEVTSE